MKYYLLLGALIHSMWSLHGLLLLLVLRILVSVVSHSASNKK